MCVFYRLTRDVMHLKKPRNIKTKPNQTKLYKCTYDMRKYLKILIFVHKTYAILYSLIRLNNFAGVQIAHQLRSF